MATKTFTATYANGVLTPSAKLDVPENAEVRIRLDTPDEAPFDERLRRFRSAAGGWQDILDCEEFLTDVYEARKVSTRPNANL